MIVVVVVVRALEAAAQVGDATLRLRDADDAAAEAALAMHELARKQEDDELDAMIASGECDVGGDEALNLSGIEAPGSHMCQVDDDPGVAELAHLLAVVRALPGRGLLAPAPLALERPYSRRSR